VLALGAELPMFAGVVAVALSVTLAVCLLEREKKLASDTLLGVFAHGALAAGLVLLSLLDSISVDVNAILFGDILSVSGADIAMIYAAAAIIGSLLVGFWRPLMRAVIHPDIAEVEGINTARLKMLLMLAIAVTVALSIQVVGILLITSMLIIPAASVRYLVRTPSQMALYSCAAGVVSVCGGLYASLIWDTPTGPSMILAGLTLFLLAYVMHHARSSSTGT
jgi:zinc transport system permease protein